jgi:hypothetical protein
MDKMVNFANIFIDTIHVATDRFLITGPHLDDNPIVFACKPFIRVSGYEEGEILGRNCVFYKVRTQSLA